MIAIKRILIILILSVLMSSEVVTFARKIETLHFLQDENRVLTDSVDLHLLNANNTLVNSTINLASENSWLFFDSIKPSIVLQNYSNFIKINGNDLTSLNCRIVVYRHGSVIIPHGSNYQALETFEDTNLSGNAQKYFIDQYYTNTPDPNVPSKKISKLDSENNIRSFKLKRGYMATFANQADGMGYSRVFIADTCDIEISELPKELDQKISFIRVFPWEWVSKKGWVGTFDKNQPDGLKYVDQQADKTNSTWYYTWGASVYGSSNATDSTLINQEFVPEKWGKGGSVGEFYNNKWSHLIGQNEPDHVEQSNLTVEEAIAEWPILMKTGARLGTPATTDFSWLYKFMDECKKRNYRVDFVVVHGYWGGKSASSWYSDLKKIHDATGRPIWIKEWNNGANWTNESWPTNYSDQQLKQLNDLKAILEVMDTASFVERYSIYNWVEDKRAILLNGVLTPAGKYYASTTPALAFNKKMEVIPVWTMLKAQFSLNFATETNKIKLSWIDPNEELTNKIIIEQSFDNQKWVLVDSLNASDAKDYEINLLASGEIPQGEVYFRIKNIGFTGSSKISNTVKYEYLKNNNSTISTARIKVKQDWSTAFFEQPFDSLTFLAGPSTYRNKYPLVTRARNVNSKSFELQLRTWSYLTDPVFSYPDTVSVLTVPPGVHQFGNVTLIAGKEAHVGKVWKTVTFKQAFNVVPVVFALQVTSNDITASAIRIRNVTTTGFDICRKYEQGKPNVYEDITYIAATPGIGTYNNGNIIEVGVTPDAVGNSYSNPAIINFSYSFDNPAFFAFMQSSNDEAGAALRIRSLKDISAQVFKERELSTVTTNYAEVVGWMVLGTGELTGLTNPDLNSEEVNFYSNNIFLTENKMMNKIEVFSLTGIRLISKKYMNSLDVSSLQPGVYITVINDGLSLKFIKL